MTDSETTVILSKDQYPTVTLSGRRLVLEKGRWIYDDEDVNAYEHNKKTVKELEERNLYLQTKLDLCLHFLHKKTKEVEQLRSELEGTVNSLNKKILFEQHIQEQANVPLNPKTQKPHFQPIHQPKVKPKQSPLPPASPKQENPTTKTVIDLSLSASTPGKETTQKEKKLQYSEFDEETEEESPPDEDIGLVQNRPARRTPSPHP
ncbi:hypothetical protein BLNAU_16044 [Blattamonas nauphoetae]|uniref:Uncharacterized protein n=1 Tax=Blattamonas nauphoetae TaxID=2049346 RepID=A0ABQ9XDV0_9EUKA|nr:hypothetical protein BLNAU_16044 [Blattamonas nauphoetae]